jgi:hypothetical protein
MGYPMRVFVVAVSCLLLGTVSVQADTRVIVQDRMSRCYAIADTRQYLDCLYGAVQPLRSELGLPAAPQALTFAPTYARAEPTAPRPAETKAEGSRSTGPVASFFNVRKDKVAAEQFGLPNARPGSGANVDHITAKMKSYSFDRRTALFTVTLENGQVWRQSSADGNLTVWRNPPSSYTATIVYGAWGSYDMTLSATQRRPFRVERVS